MAITLADAIVRILPDDTELGPGFQKAKASAQTFASDLSGKVVAATKVAVAGIIGLGAGAVAAGANFVRLGSDAEEMLGKFNVVFTNTGGQVTEQLTIFSEAVGRSKFELMEMASTFGDTLKPMGFTEQAAADMSVQLTQLATDLGSFNNMPMDEALRRLQGTLIGSHENALAFGVIINENTLKAKLAANGWDELTGAELEQAKVQARLQLLMEGTTDAQGDAERTSGSWANQMRALAATLKDTATEIGLKLLPVVTPLLQKLGEWAKTILPPLVEQLGQKLIPILQKVSDAFMQMVSGDVQGGLETLFGPETTAKIMHFVGVIGDVIEKVSTFVREHAPELKAALLALAVAFGVVATAAAIGAVISALTNPIGLIVAAIALLAAAWEGDWLGIRTTLTKAWEAIQPALEAIGNFIKNLMTTIGDYFKDAFAFWRELFAAFGALFRGDFEGFFEHIRKAWEKYFAWIGNFLENIGKLLEPIVGNLGRRIIEGIGNGIRNFGSAVANALGDVVDAAILAIKRKLGIASPSRLMALQIGGPLAAGVGEGFQSQMRLETGDMLGSLAGAVQAMGGMTYAPTVSIDARGSGMSENGLRRMVQDELKRSGREADMLRRSGR